MHPLTSMAIAAAAAALTWALVPGVGSAEPAPAAGARSATTDRGSYVVEIHPSPDPIPLNRLFELTVSVRQATDRSPSPASVSLAVGAQMPAHNHGMNTRAVATRTRDGEWSVKGMLLHMPGDWQLIVAVLGAGSVEQASFDVRLN